NLDDMGTRRAEGMHKAVGMTQQEYPHMRSNISNHLKNQGRCGNTESELIVWYAEQIEDQIQDINQLYDAQGRLQECIAMMIREGIITVLRPSRIPKAPEHRVLICETCKWRQGPLLWPQPVVGDPVVDSDDDHGGCCL
ncbi:MAG: hypothetical protein ACKPKO_55335, partial [Candidatus Fonsibacter sp.]